jgi:heme exporter protein C
MVTAMLLMVAAFWLYSAAVALARVRGIIAEREPGAVLSGGTPAAGSPDGAAAGGVQRGSRSEAP